MIVEFLNENLTYRDIFEFDIDLMNCILNNTKIAKKLGKYFMNFIKTLMDTLWNLTSIKLSMV